MIKALLFSSLLLSVLFAQPDFTRETLYKADITSQTAYSLQQKGAVLIDVRTQQEFQTSHAKGSINIPLFLEQKGQRVFNQEFLTQINDALKSNLEQDVLLICRSGSRTKVASNLLAYQGFSNVYNIKQGFAYDWSKTNLPVEK